MSESAGAAVHEHFAPPADAVVWGSDWPHVMVKGVMPNDGDLADLLLDWIPDGVCATACWSTTQRVCTVSRACEPTFSYLQEQSL